MGGKRLEKRKGHHFYDGPPGFRKHVGSIRAQSEGLELPDPRRILAFRSGSRSSGPFAGASTSVRALSDKLGKS